MNDVSTPETQPKPEETTTPTGEESTPSQEVPQTSQEVGSPETQSGWEPKETASPVKTPSKPTVQKKPVTVSTLDRSFEKEYDNVVRAGWDLVKFDKDGQMVGAGQPGKKSQAHWTNYLKNQGVKITRGRFSNLSNGNQNVTKQISQVVTKVLEDKGYLVQK